MILLNLKEPPAPERRWRDKVTGEQLRGWEGGRSVSPGHNLI